MARVRSVMASASSFSSRFRVSSRMSTNTGTAPRSKNALTVETKVNDGTITSSPGSRSSSSADISSAWVHEVVSRQLPPPTRARSSSAARAVKGPSPEVAPEARDASMFSISFGTR